MYSSETKPEPSRAMRTVIGSLLGHPTPTAWGGASGPEQGVAPGAHLGLGLGRGRHQTRFPQAPPAQSLDAGAVEDVAQDRAVGADRVQIQEAAAGGDGAASLAVELRDARGRLDVVEAARRH